MNAILEQTFVFPFRVAVVIVFFVCVGCEGESGVPEKAVADVAKADWVILTSGQRERAKIVTAVVEKSPVNVSREITGWLEVPPGREMVVRAPVSGLLAIKSNKPPAIGDLVERGSQTLTLQMFLSPTEISQLVQAKEDTDIQIEQAFVSMQLAENQLRLLANAQETVSATKINELKDQFERSKAAIKEAREKLPFLIPEPYADKIPLKPVELPLPISGRISHIHAVAEQLVLQGDPIWTVADTSELWLRIPVFEMDLPHFQQTLPVVIRTAGTLQTSEATPLELPLTTRPNTRTVDLLYKVANPHGSLRAGQSLLASIPQTRAGEAIIVPAASILYDSWGNAFVYVEREENAFDRHRVELGSPVKEGFPVLRGLASGEKVVTQGGATLYAEEFKSGIAVEDDD